MELAQQLRVERDLAGHERMRDWEASMDKHLPLSLDVHLVMEAQLLVDVRRHLGHTGWHLGINKWSELSEWRQCNTNKHIPNYPLFSEKAIGQNAWVTL